MAQSARHMDGERKAATAFVFADSVCHWNRIVVCIAAARILGQRNFGGDYSGSFIFQYRAILSRAGAHFTVDRSVLLDDCGRHYNNLGKIFVNRRTASC